MSQLLGVDLSSFNKEADFNRIRDLGIEFIMIRSSWSTDQLDSFYTKNKDKAREWGFEVGLYHTVYPQVNTPEAEADQFIRTVSDLREGEVLAIDLETQGGNWDDWCVRFSKRIEEHFNGLKPLIYTNLNFINQAGGFPNFRANNNGLWIASGNNDASNPPTTPWEVTAIHQFILDGDAHGMCASGRIDQNNFFGSRTQFKKYGFQPVVVPPPVDPIPPIEPVLEVEYQVKVIDPNGLIIYFVGELTADAATELFASVKNWILPGHTATVYKWDKTNSNVLTLIITYTKPMENPVPPVVIVPTVPTPQQSIQAFIADLVARLTSRKFLLTLGTVLALWNTPGITLKQAAIGSVILIIGYLGAEGAADVAKAFAQRSQVVPAGDTNTINSK